MPVGNGSDQGTETDPGSPSIHLPKGSWVDGDVLAPFVGKRLVFRKSGTTEKLAETKDPIESVDDLVILFKQGDSYGTFVLKKAPR